MVRFLTVVDDEEETDGPEDETEDAPGEPEDEEDETEAEDAALEERCREVFKRAGWDVTAINDRVEYHRREEGHMRNLAERLQRNHAEAWEATTPDASEPTDGLAE